jgi:pilus assembly protein Flp/PilA
MSCVHVRRVSTVKRFEGVGRVSMGSIHDRLRALCEDESGQDLIEYALVAGLISLGAITAMSGLATRIGNAFNSVGSQLASAL